MGASRIHRSFDRAHGCRASHGQTLLKPHAWHHHQQRHHPGADRIGRLAGRRRALTQNSTGRAVVFRGGAVVNQRTRLRPLVLAVGRRWADPSPARREFGSRSFVFPQMQIEKIERDRFHIDGWRPGFVDYLFIALTQSSTFGPTDAPLLARWAKLLTMAQICISLTIVIVLISRAIGVL